MPELSQLALALAAVALVFSLLGAVRRAGREAIGFAGLIVADLGLCGLALRQPEPHGPLLWAALGGVSLLVVVPRVLAGMQAAAIRAGDLQRALALQRWRGRLQPGTHADGLHTLEELCRRLQSPPSPEVPPADWARALLRPRLDPSLRLLVLEVSFTALAAAGRGEELLALLEAEGGESLLALSPRIAAAAAPFLLAAGRDVGIEPVRALPGQGPASAPSRQRRTPIYRQAPVSLALIAVIGFIQLALAWLGPADENAALLRFGGNFPPITLHGEPWRLLAAVFLHGGWLHLVVNAYALYALGRFVEPLFGSTRLFIIFISTGLCGSAASALLGHADRLSVGASGAIFGLLGAALAALLRLRGIINETWRRQVLFNLLVIVALNLWIGYSVKVIDNWAHLGGLGGGLIVGLLLAPRPGRPEGRAARILSRAVAGLLLAAVVATGVAVAVTPTSRSLARLPWHSVKQHALSLEVPASMSRDSEARELVLRDPLLRIGLLTAEVDFLPRGRTVEEELVAMAAAQRKELEEQKGVSAIEPLPSGELPSLGPPGTARVAVRFNLEGERFVEVLLVRREGDLLLQLRAALPASRLREAAPILGRMFATLRYRQSG